LDVSFIVGLFRGGLIFLFSRKFFSRILILLSSSASLRLQAEFQQEIDNYSIRSGLRQFASMRLSSSNLMQTIDTALKLFGERHKAVTQKS